MGPACGADTLRLSRISLAASLALHSAALGFLGLAARPPPARVVTTCEVSLKAPEAEATGPVPLSELDAAASPGPVQDCPYWVAVRSRIERRIRRACEFEGGVARTGAVVVRLEITAEGALVRAEILKPGVYPELEQIVLDAVRNSAPFPAPRPRRRERIPLVVFLPVRFVPA
jgi:TonB family protein